MVMWNVLAGRMREEKELPAVFSPIGEVTTADQALDALDLVYSIENLDSLKKICADIVDVLVKGGGIFGSIIIPKDQLKDEPLNSFKGLKEELEQTGQLRLNAILSKGIIPDRLITPGKNSNLYLFSPKFIESLNSPSETEGIPLSGDFDSWSFKEVDQILGRTIKYRIKRDNPSMPDIVNFTALGRICRAAAKFKQLHPNSGTGGVNAPRRM